MPSTRAILIDIEQHKLDPNVEHVNVSKSGHLQNANKKVEVKLQNEVNDALIVESKSSIEDEIVEDKHLNVTNGTVHIENDEPKLTEEIISVEQPTEQVVEETAEETVEETIVSEQNNDQTAEQSVVPFMKKRGKKST